MPQISLYIDEKTLEKVENAALKQHVSISKWVADQLRARIEPSYPTGFEELFGSVKDKSFIRPDEVASSRDIIREKL
jgi:hypothetical protein